MRQLDSQEHASNQKKIAIEAATSALVVVMVLAAGLHLYPGEFAALPINVALGVLAAFVAWGRTQWAPIAPR